MSNPQELNEEELSSIAGGASAGDRVIQISMDKPGHKSTITIAEKDLAKWQQRQTDRGHDLSQYTYKYGTFVSPGNINWD